jgi:hypothetical protein
MPVKVPWGVSNPHIHLWLTARRRQAQLASLHEEGFDPPVGTE